MKFKKIKDLREDNDKLLKDIAYLLGISQQYYSEYESGKRTIPFQHLITLANYYNTSIDYIVGLSDLKNITTNKKQVDFNIFILKICTCFLSLYFHLCS